MSAFLVTARHIATLAAYIHSEVRPAGKTRAEIATALALENVASVTFRYGPEGAAAYAPIFAGIEGALSASGWQVPDRPAPEETPEAAASEFLPEGVTLGQFLHQCREMAYVPAATDAEMHGYLSCYRYQACEHEGWQTSDACQWTRQALDNAALAMARKLLKGRHVWSVPDLQAA